MTDENQMREWRGDQTLASYTALSADPYGAGRTREEVITDLFADLMHFCEREGIDHETCHASAITHVIEER